MAGGSTDEVPAGPPAAAAPRRRRLYDQPYLLLALAPLFWSGNIVLGRAVHEAVPPVGLAFCRWFGALLIVLPFAWPWLRRDWPALVRAWPAVLLLALLGIAVFNALGYYALGHTTAINGLLLQSIIPVLILLISLALFGERVTPRRAVGVAVSLLGAVTVITGGDPAVLATLSFNVGDVWMFVAVWCYAAYSALLRLRPAVHPLSFLAATFGAGAAMLLPVFLFEQAFVRALEPSATTFLAIAYVAVFPSLLAYFCFNRGVELIGANRAGAFIHLMPFFGTVMAVLFLGETFRPSHAVGIALILGGIFLASRAAPR